LKSKQENKVYVAFSFKKSYAVGKKKLFILCYMMYNPYIAIKFTERRYGRFIFIRLSRLCCEAKY
jgi:hypothetical protein